MLGKAESGYSREFPTTRWTLIQRAAGNGESAYDALAHLCQAYWPPVFHYFRRLEGSVEDSEDLTQGFFEDLLSRKSFGNASPEQGKFRTFLLAWASNYRAKEYRYRKAQKRGGESRILHIDFSDEETDIEVHLFRQFNPEEAFDRRWAMQLIDRSFQKLKANYASDEKGDLFEALQGHLLPSLSSAESYEDTAHLLGMQPGAVRTAASRLKKRFARLLREEIADTLAEGEDVEEEMAAMLRLLGNAT